MRFSRMSIFLPFVVAALVATTGTPAHAQDAKTFYKGKVIKFVVGVGPGGGYDAYARMLAPHFEKALGATVVVENQPGAGGLTALNRIYAAQPDGLQIMIVNGVAAALTQLLDQPNVRYDLAKVGNLGIVNAEPWVWLVNPTFPHKSLADVMKSGRKISWAAAGMISGLSDGAAFTCEALKLDCKIVIAYPGSNDASLAMLRGEMDALYVSDTSANNFVSAGQAVPVVSMTRERNARYFPDTPTIFEAVDLSPEQAWWFDFRITLDTLGRILVTPPNVPQDRLAFLQAMIRSVLTDPAVIAEGEKTQRYIDYQAPEKAQKMISDIVSSISPEQKRRVQEVVTKKYF